MKFICKKCKKISHAKDFDDIVKKGKICNDCTRKWHKSMFMKAINKK